jgi:hypothetical protein
LTAEEANAIRNGNSRPYFVGTILYTDTTAGQVRQTAFCRYCSFKPR